MPTIPSHVPANLVHDCPIAERKIVFENVFETRIAGEHHAKPPIYWCSNIYRADNSGGWIVRRVADLKEIYADDECFTKQGFSSFAKLIGEDWNLVPTELTGAMHQQVRQVLNPAFSPARMFALDGMVRKRARDLISGFRDFGKCNFIEDFAVPFPVSIFLDLFGLPQAQVSQFLGWEHCLLHSPDIETRKKATREVKTCLLDAIAERRKTPQDDLISDALTYAYDGKPWSTEMVYGYCFNLFVGGLDTVTANLGLHLYHLASHPANQAELRAEPAKITLAIEEMLRAYAAVTTYRTVTREVDFHGVRMMPGDRVAMSTSLTSRDPEAWENPNEIRFDRRPSHLALGSSSHRCLGMHLARRELLIAEQEILANLPEFHLEDAENVPFLLGNIIQPTNLQLRW